jgi:FtsP/CotA-like multicopper oxidase with cupredoxin domain
VAEQQNLNIGGRSVPDYTLNGSSPGPTITTRQGELVEVRLRNATVKAGIAMHWHGDDVPAAMDGVAGVTQDEVPIGGEFIYRFVAHQVGTYWYQVSHEQVIGGLFGTLVVLPKNGRSNAVDVVATAHTYSGIKTINGVAGDLKVSAKPGQQVRVRVINTDNAQSRRGQTGGLILELPGHMAAGRYGSKSQRAPLSFWGRAILPRRPQPVAAVDV